MSVSNDRSAGGPPRPAAAGQAMPEPARIVMVQGTGSHAGKTVLVAALCRIYARRGLRVAPFKAQNMALNSAVTAEGGEMGRAQVYQAGAAGLEPHVDMNPVLLKPSSEKASQVVVMGRPVADMTVAQYHAFQAQVWPIVTAALARLRATSDLVVAERAWHAKLAERGIRPQGGLGFAIVRQFRKRALPAGLIAEAQVAAWIEAQLAREGEPAAAYWRVPLGQQELAALEEPADDPRQGCASLLHGIAQRLADEPQGELPGSQPEPRLRLCYAAPDGELRLAHIRGDGQVAALKAVAASLCAHFDGWSEDEAVAYVLSGYVPPLDKLRARTRRGLFRAASRITYDVDPRTSPAALAEFHTRLRTRWVEGRNRLLADKALALAAFVECRWRPEVSWEELQARWNDEHPEGDLHSEVSVNQFATECRDAWERLTGEIWPQSVRAARRLRRDLDAARARRKERSLPDEQRPT